MKMARWPAPEVRKTATEAAIRLSGAADDILDEHIAMAQAWPPTTNADIRDEMLDMAEGFASVVPEPDKPADVMVGVLAGMLAAAVQRLARQQRGNH